MSRLARGALAGGAAGLLGLAAAELVSGALAQPVTPVLAVGQAVVEAVPGGLAKRAIEVLGTADKPVLVTSVVLAALGLSALAGALAARHFAAGFGLMALLAAVGCFATLSRPGLGAYGVLPAVVGALVALVAFTILLDAVGARADTAGRLAGPTRRDALRAIGLTGALAIVAGGAGRWLAARRSGIEAARSAAAGTASPTVVPPGADLGVPGVTAWRTPVDTFYRIDTALTPPLVDPAGWRLRVHGLVERELELDFAGLRARPPVDAWVTLTCVSNEVGGDLAGNARWTGARLSELLREAGPRPGADCVLSTSADGWTSSTPLEALTDGRDALLAYAMDGSPLPVEHGYPVRMVVPGLYGFVSATKWVVDLDVTRFADVTAYWTSRGWSARAPIKTAARIDVPRNGSEVAAGRVAVGGVAWAQHRGISKVEVRVAGEPWHEARLGGVPSDDTWRQWVWVWDAAPGSYTLQVRATDGNGAVQTEAVAPPDPDGATGWHSIDVAVR